MAIVKLSLMKQAGILSSRSTVPLFRLAILRTLVVELCDGKQACGIA
jgi:hypothetical protein